MTVTIDQLTRIVDTTSPTDLEGIVAATGHDAVLVSLRQVFDRLVTEFNPTKAKGNSGRFQFEIATAAGQTIPYYVDVVDGTCAAAPGVIGEPNVTIGIKYPDMLLMGMGRLPGSRAFLTGKLKLRGNPLFGTKLGDWFDHP